MYFKAISIPVLTCQVMERFFAPRLINWKDFGKRESRISQLAKESDCECGPFYQGFLSHILLLNFMFSFLALDIEVEG